MKLYAKQSTFEFLYFFCHLPQPECELKGDKLKSINKPQGNADSVYNGNTQLKVFNFF